MHCVMTNSSRNVLEDQNTENLGNIRGIKQQIVYIVTPITITGRFSLYRRIPSKPFLCMNGKLEEGKTMPYQDKLNHFMR